MEIFNNLNYENIMHDLVIIASSDRLFNILDKKSQEELLRRVFKYTKRCLKTLEQQNNFTSEDDEEFYNQRGSR